MKGRSLHTSRPVESTFCMTRLKLRSKRPEPHFTTNRTLGYRNKDEGRVHVVLHLWGVCHHEGCKEAYMKGYYLVDVCKDHWTLCGLTDWVQINIYLTNSTTCTPLGRLDEFNCEALSFSSIDEFWHLCTIWHPFLNLLLMKEMYIGMIVIYFSNSSIIPFLLLSFEITLVETSCSNK